MSLRPPPPPAPPPGPPPIFDRERSKGRLSGWFPKLTEPELSSLLVYLEELVKFNKAINLVSANTLPVADAAHLADAIYAHRIVMPRLIPGEPLYDLGSGNGFPGLVFAILQPGLPVVLVDRDERKLEFCKHVASQTKLTNLRTQKTEIEDLPEGSIKNAVARGFASLGRSLLVTRKKFPAGGRFFHLKGDQWAMELAQVPTQLFSSWQPSLIGEYRLPDNGAQNFVVLTDKTGD